jgi:hypothetical protein
MQQLITPAAYARLRNLNRSTVSRQIHAGVIPVHQGRVDPAEADLARDRDLCVVHSASARLRKQLAAAAPASTIRFGQSAPPAARRNADFELGLRAGRAQMALHVASALNRSFPELLLAMKLDRLPPADRVDAVRLAAIALVDHMVRAWLEDPLRDAAALGLGAVADISLKCLSRGEAAAARQVIDALKRAWGDGVSEPQEAKHGAPEPERGKEENDLRIENESVGVSGDRSPR